MQIVDIDASSHGDLDVSIEGATEISEIGIEDTVQSHSPRSIMGLTIGASMEIFMRLTALMLVVLTFATSATATQPPTTQLAKLETNESAPLTPVRQLAVAPSGEIPPDFQASSQLEVYGHFNTIGLIAVLPEESDDTQ